MTKTANSPIDYFASHPSLVVREALDVAIAAHDGQVRRYTGEPFVLHPVAVAHVASEYERDPLVLAAALLHDVVEDTEVTASDLASRFPASVVRMVLSLTNPSQPTDGDRASRKAIDHAHVVRADSRSQTIKYADVFLNVRSIAQHDPDFAKHVYLPQKASLINRLDRGHPRLRQRVQDCIQELIRNLEENDAAGASGPDCTV
ncbi:HD domain-containing protein [Guyparkeria hydrothermalis]|uniref:HD domain-containing protein n=1 Tax=Guyparkeria hydrothermalis TaxID=923 RepID=UPI002021035A|nr:HD domain-containing protein [Guyparkeria hydrothermalis]MCL7744368.1 HD domain-containing protein [Guyparkeria hydrothermalis]